MFGYSALYSCSKNRMDYETNIATDAITAISYETGKQPGTHADPACHDIARGLSAQEYLDAATGNQDICCRQIDKENFQMARSFAIATIRSSEVHMDVLIIKDTGRIMLEDGDVEAAPAAVLLTSVLLEMLKVPGPIRARDLITLMNQYRRVNTQMAAKRARYAWTRNVNFININLPSVALTRNLSRLLERAGINNCAHNPLNMQAIMKMFFKLPRDGAHTAMILAMAPDLTMTRNFVDCKEVRLGPTIRAFVVVRTGRLWKIPETVERLCGPQPAPPPPRRRRRRPRRRFVGRARA